MRTYEIVSVTYDRHSDEVEKAVKSIRATLEDLSRMRVGDLEKLPEMIERDLEKLEVAMNDIWEALELVDPS